MAEPRELLPKLDIVIDLAVECDDEIAFRRCHRLAALREIDDRKAAMPEREPSVVPESTVVRSTMREQPNQPAPQLGVGAKVTRRKMTEDAAHQVASESRFHSRRTYASCDCAL